MDLSELGLSVEAITFGTPRSGNVEFAAYFDLMVPRSWRVTHFRDIVPHLPPKHLNLRWKHSSREAFFDEPFVLQQICNNTAELPLCSDSLDHFNVKDHLSYFNLTHFQCHNVTAN